MRRGEPQYFKAPENPVLIKVNYVINQICNLRGSLVQVQVELHGAIVSYLKIKLTLSNLKN